MNTNETTNETTDTRYTAEWEPVARVKKHKGHKTMDRKVLTRGVMNTYVNNNLLSLIVKDLRQGYEVRLCSGNGEAFLRIFPVLSKDCTKIFAAAQAMEPLSQSLGGIKPTIHRRGKGAISEGETAYMVREAVQRWTIDKAKASEMLEVTPDTMVTCPNCSTPFRVGRSFARN